ncbi:hypothetical protein D3C72_2268000 [compost metagenome]
MKYGIPNGEVNLDVAARTGIKADFNLIRDELRVLDDEHESQNEDGVYSEYVKAALSTTTKQAQRIARSRTLVRILSAG